MALLTAGGVLSCAGVVGGYALTSTKSMSSGHMEPSLPVGSSMTFNLLATEADRGDVVLFDGAAWGEQRLIVERVVAVGGDRIAYSPGDRTLTLNGKPLEEPYVLDGDPVAGSPGAFSVDVPEGRLFVLGDHRFDSADSRYRSADSEGGTIPLSAVKGSLLNDDDPLRTGLLATVATSVGLLLLGAVAGVAARHSRRR
ncbi:signal peptidase I [Kitasatospora sp. NPDC051853]|uniref:signal peptidase I n=1 Tax=Kitasatospora sp. NPDC051853 TaxID=3364058 RepID=UPI0037BB3931